MPRFLTAALYKFVDLPDCAQLQPRLLAVCEANRIKGTLLLANEGINGTIAGAPEDIHTVLGWLRSDPRMADLQHKEAWASEPPFLRMKVRLKAEIVTMHVPGLDPSRLAGTYVKPQDWNALISAPDVVVIDARNDYEVAIGSFHGALDPHTRSFSELPAWVQQQTAPGKALASTQGRKPRVAMFCTGGIRCEKSTAYLRSQGFDQVYHLQGGILKYLETVPQSESLWEGECFVFDERVSVGHGLQEGALELCRSCRRPIGAAEKSSDKYEAGISCPHCFDGLTEARKKGFAERQRQVELARQRHQQHIGARMPDKRGDGPAPV
jgi:UPF0176 protein